MLIFCVIFQLEAKFYLSNLCQLPLSVEISRWEIILF